MGALIAVVGLALAVRLVQRAVELVRELRAMHAEFQAELVRQLQADAMTRLAAEDPR